MNSDRDEVSVLEVAILCLCARFHNVQNLDGFGPFQVKDVEDFATYVKKHLSKSMHKPPNLIILQVYLVISMYEWGSGNSYLAWMYTGIAIRMMQSLQTKTKDKDLSELDQEVENRTFWSCFIMDRLIYSGATQPFSLPMKNLNVKLPIGEQDFAFGRASGPRLVAKHFVTANPKPTVPTDCDQCYSVLVRGFDIWSKVLKHVISGGRKHNEMWKPANFPWAKTSPWNVMYESLKDWWEKQHDRLKYPQCSVAPHAALNQGESFAFVNLIYHASLLFLHREYIPFLLNKESEPVGPIDPPLLEKVAPAGWWEKGSAHLFNTASCITRILQDLEACGTPLFTSFTGFHAFSAATMNLYVSAFPRMYLHRSLDGEELAKLDFRYLERFQALWKMGIGWYKTAEKTRDLYQRINEDQSRFRGKTVCDFQALKVSMYEPTRTSPADDSNPRTSPVPPHRNTTALSVLADASSQVLLGATNSTAQDAGSNVPKILEPLPIYPHRLSK